MEEASLPACLQRARRRLEELVQREPSPSTSESELKNHFGLVYFSVIPVDDENTMVDGTIMEEGFTVYVHNYTGFFRKPVEGRIHQGRNPVPVKVWRIIDDATGDWMEQEYVIVLVTKNYFGIRLVKVKPDKPVMNIDVEIHINKKEAMFNHVLEKPKLPVLLSEKLPYLPIRDSIAEEEASRIKAYLAMLDGERNCGLISEKAYRRLRQKLESVLYEIIFGGGLGEPIEKRILQYIIQ